MEKLAAEWKQIRPVRTEQTIKFSKDGVVIIIQSQRRTSTLFLAGFWTLFFLAVVAIPVLAHQPLLERQLKQQVGEANLENAQHISDPTLASQAIYGRLSSPGEIDIYYFIPQKTEIIPFQLLVPVRVSNQNFRPTLAVIGDDLQSKTHGVLPFPVPPDNQAVVLSPGAEPSVFFEPFSVESLLKMTEKSLSVTAGHHYYLVVYNQDLLVGDYTIGVGTAENFQNSSFLEITKNVLLMKLGLVDQRTVPWLDILGLFVFLAGFVIGLGAVTVIDLHGFLGITSSYWTEATTRTHKVTKPLIWIGFSLAVTGAAILYRQTGLNGVATFQAALAVLLFFNGLFLSFWVSPRLLQREKEGRAGELLPTSWQVKIAISFIFSFISWWGSLFLLVWYLLVTR